MWIGSADSMQLSGPDVSTATSQGFHPVQR